MIRDDIDVSPDKSFKNMIVADNNYLKNEKKYRRYIPWNIGEYEKVYHNELVDRQPVHSSYKMLNSYNISYTTLYNEYDLSYNPVTNLYRWSAPNDERLDILVSADDMMNYDNTFIRTNTNISYTISYKNTTTNFNEYYMDAVGNIYRKNNTKVNQISLLKNDSISIEEGELDRCVVYTRNNLNDILAKPDLKEDYKEHNYRLRISHDLFDEEETMFENEIYEHNDNKVMFTERNEVLKKEGVRFCPWFTYKDLYRRQNNRREMNYITDYDLKLILYGEKKEEFHFDSYESHDDKNIDYDLLVEELITDISSITESRGSDIESNNLTYFL